MNGRRKSAAGARSCIFSRLFFSPLLMTKKLLPFALPVLLLLFWWGITKTGSVPALLLPGPGAVAERFVSLLASGELFHHAATSMLRVFSGFLISASMALALALLVSRSERLFDFLSLTLEALRVVPPLSLVPLLILWLGIDEAPKLAIVVLASFFPIYLSALTALSKARNDYRDLARIFGLSERDAARHILIPGASPGIITGLRLGFGYAWRALVGSELIAAASGLGYLIEDASALARTDVVMVGILTIAVLGIICDKLFRIAAERAAPWTVSRKGTTSLEALPPEAPKGVRTVDAARELSAALPGIEIRNLTVGYPGLAKPPVSNLTVSIPGGKVTAVLGRSGCGKTTLIKAISRLIEKEKGDIRFTGGKSAPRLSMVFQEPLLLPWKTVRENVALSLLPECGERALNDPRVSEALSLVGLSNRAESFPGELSGGQQQRVGFARALASDPEVLLMDEPFGALDALTREELQDESIEVFSRRLMTVLMITHDVREAVRMADSAVILESDRAPEIFAIDLPRPRRLSSPGVARLEEEILSILMRR